MKLFKLIAFSLIVLLLQTSCNKSVDLTDTIPADANIVIHINNRKLIDKSEYDIFKNKQVKMLITMLQGFSQNEKRDKLIEDFKKDINSIGLNIKGDIYIFSNVYQGLIIEVNDADKIKENLINSSIVNESDIKKDKGIFYISESNGSVISWDDSKMIILGDLGLKRMMIANDSLLTEFEGLEEYSKKLLQQTHDKSINSVKAFVEFKENQKDISIYNGLNNMEYALAYYTILFPELNIKEYINKLKNLSSGAFISFEKGKITLENETYHLNRETKDSIQAIFSELSRPIQGDHLEYIPDDPSFGITINLQGEAIYNMFTRFEVLDSSAVRKEMEIIKEIDGDVSFILNNHDSKNEPTSILALFQTSKPIEAFEKTRKIVKEENSSYQSVNDSTFTFYIIENGDYERQGSFNQLRVGRNGNMLYISNGKLDRYNSENKYKELFKNNNSVIYGNINNLLPAIENEMYLSKTLPFFKEFTTYQYLFSINNGFAGTGELNLKIKDKNSLAVICLLIDGMINDFSSFFNL